MTASTRRHADSSVPDESRQQRRKHPEARARDYVEGVLRADEVSDEAQAALEALASAHREIITTSRAKRELVEVIDTREFAVAEQERLANADLSVAAFERHLKPVLHADEELVRLRSELRLLSAQHEQAELDARLHERTITVKSSRMEELAGILTFYASVKNSIGAANDTNQ